MKNYTTKLSGIDLFKFIAAVLVLLSHVGLFSSYSAQLDAFFINTVFRWAVPFFFMASGYFMPRSWKKLARYLVRILILYIVWSILYCLVLRQDLRLLPFNLFPSNGYTISFWFFPSLLACVLFIFLLTQLLGKKGSCLAPFFFVAYLWGTLGDSYYNLWPGNPIFTLNAQIWGGTTRNGLFFGSFFIYLGNLLSNNSDLLLLVKALPTKLLVCCSCIGVAFSFFEFWIYHHFQTGVDFNLSLSCIPLCFMLFLLALKLEISRKKSLFLRQLSTLLYVIHPLFVSANSPLYCSLTNSVVRFATVLALSLLLSAAILFLSRKVKVLRFLY